MTGLARIVLLFLLLAAVPSQAASSYLAQGAFHFEIGDYGSDMNAAGGISLDLAWRPIPELGLGLELSLGGPWKNEDDPGKAIVGARVLPTLWLFFGSHRSWAYLRTGAGWVTHLRHEDSTWQSGWVLTAAGGYAVAPPSLVLYFGFEVVADLHIGGGSASDRVGLGAFIGYRFK